MRQNFICINLSFAWEHAISMNTVSLSLPVLPHAYYSYDSKPHQVTVHRYKWNKFYQAFKALNTVASHAHLAMREHYESNKFYDATNAFDASHALDPNVH